MAEVFKEPQVFEVQDLVRKVTMLEILLLALDWDKPEFCRQLQLRCGESLHRRTVGWWEARRHTPSKHADRSLRILFEVASVAMLGLGSRDAAPYWTWMTPEEIEEEMLDRRQMLRSMGLAGAAGAAGLLLPVSDLVGDAQDLESLGHIGLGAVRASQKTATNLAITFKAAPNAEAVRAAKAHAYTLLDVLASGRATMSDPARIQLRAVASDAAALAGYGDMNAGRLDDADRWFTCALDLAREAGDRRLEALALGSKAWISLYRPEPDRAAVIGALQGAAGFQAVLRPAGRAWVFGYLAREYAALGDDLGSGRFLEEAQAVAGLIPHDEPGWGWWSVHGELGWDSARASGIAGPRLLELGRPAEALEMFDAELVNRTKPVGLAYHHRLTARACVALDDLERACASGRAGLAVAKAHGLGLWPGEMRKVRRVFPDKWGSHPLVLDLDELLRVAA